MQIKNLPVAAWQEGSLFVATCLVNQVTSQGKTREEALINLQEALELYFEDDSFSELPDFKQVEASNLTIQA